MQPTLAKTIIHDPVDQVALALKKEPDIDYIDEFGYTPLIETCIVNDINKTKLLLQHGVDINKTDLTGRNPLHWAVENSNLPLITLLLEHGANPNAFTSSCQPIMARPILRRQRQLVDLLRKHGGDLTFAKDYIYTKLLGHRFELRGHVDLVEASGRFADVDLEGFFLEFSLDMIAQSVQDFQNNYAARELKWAAGSLRLIYEALKRAQRLSQIQHYLVDYEQYSTRITDIFNQDPLIIPVAQEGHALTLIRYKHLIAICDRMQREGNTDHIKLYVMKRPDRFTQTLMSQLIYTNQFLTTFHELLPKMLGLECIYELPIPSQIAGNCAWANVEATVPALYWMLDRVHLPSFLVNPAQALTVYEEWQRWDQDRALTFFINRFPKASRARKASMASVLAAVMFQRCSAQDPTGLERAMKIMPILKTPGYEYLLESYIEVFCHQQMTEAGKNLKELIKQYQYVAWE